MLAEYDFSDGMRGKYAARFRSGTNLVKIDPALAPYFSDSNSVNEALAMLVTIARRIHS